MSTPAPQSPAVFTGSLVRELPFGVSPGVYRVQSITRNGWATCVLECFSDGAHADPAAAPVKFRLSQLGAVK